MEQRPLHFGELSAADFRRLLKKVFGARKSRVGFSLPMRIWDVSQFKNAQ
jgi:hypothetical protein